MEATISDINVAFKDGSLTAEKLVKLDLDRIEAYDSKGPGIHAMILAAWLPWDPSGSGSTTSWARMHGI
jgi:Asp-tRNA(Asn)/Glu-tRNA(Gln) amidotransferase A subunit family amidase